MKTVLNIWNSFKTRPDVWFFYAFLLTSTLSVRKVLFYYPINGTFNEYTGIYIYLSDIFLFLTIFCWLFILCNNLSFLSIYNSTLSVFQGIKNVPPQYKCSTWNIVRGRRGTFSWLKTSYQHFVHNLILIFPFILAIFSFISITWSNNPTIATYRSIKLLLFVLLFYYVRKLFQACSAEKKCSTPIQMFHVEHCTGQAWNISSVCKTELSNENVTDSMLAPCSQNVPRGTFCEFTGWNIFRISFLIIIFSGFIQSIIGIFQFAIQHSVGLLWLKESIISPSLPGVAKLIFQGESFVRSYGLFPHPNILGGFLVMSIFVTLAYLKMFHACPVANKCSTPAPYNVPRGTFVSGWNICSASVVEHFKLKIFKISLVIQLLALFLTFSKSAIIGLGVGFLFLHFSKCSTWNILKDNQNSTIVPRGTIVDRLFSMFQACSVEKKCSTWNISSASGVEHSIRKTLLIIGIIGISLFLLKIDKNVLFIKSLNERFFYLNVSRGTFFDHPLIGIGTGQFVPKLAAVPNIQTWQFQPVHNVFLLILNEYGIFIFIGFIFFILKMFHVEHFNKQEWNNSKSDMFHACPVANKCSTPAPYNVPRGTFVSGWNICSASGMEHFDSLNPIYPYFKATLLSFTFVMLFDHYLWDIQQGQIMLWLVLGFLASRAGK